MFAINPSAERTFEAFKVRLALFAAKNPPLSLVFVQARATGASPSGSAGPAASVTGGGAAASETATSTGAETATPSSGAIRLAGTTSLLALVGLVAGLTL